MGDLRRTISMRAIEIGRKLFANTPVQRWPVTTAILRRVFALGYGTEELEVRFRELTMIVPANDITIVPGIVGGFYEAMELDVLTALAPLCSDVVDVGANIGVYACLAASHMPQGRVAVFEPVPANLDYLRRNLAVNGVSERVEVVEAALGEQAGTAAIYLADSIGTHSLASANAESDRHIDVSVTTLDEWLGERRMDLLKVDVEGFDGFVLRGARRTLARDRPTLLLEFTPQSLRAAGFDPTELLRLIFELYERVLIIDEPRHTLRPASYEDLQTFVDRSGNWNVVAVSNPRHREAISAQWPDL